jgi:hypothetical protein
MKGNGNRGNVTESSNVAVARVKNRERSDMGNFSKQKQLVVETARQLFVGETPHTALSTGAKPACAGLKVRAGGLRFYSCEFHSPG